MRPYPPNSPQAAGRIVAVAMLADGQMTRPELDAFARSKALGRLGLTPSEWHTIVQSLCDDLLTSALMVEDEMCTIDAQVLDALMEEVVDVALRRTVFNLCVTVVMADAHVAEEESTVLTAASAAWNIHRDLRRPLPSGTTAGNAIAPA